MTISGTRESFCLTLTSLLGFSGGSAVKKHLPMQATLVQSLGWEDPLEEDNPLQFSCLENPTDRGAWWATVHEVMKELDMTEHSTHT